VDAQAAEPLAALAAAAGKGDRKAFERLVVTTSPGVYALAMRLVGNEHDASDVVQETYLRAFRSIDRFRGDAAVTTWLYRIAANCSSTHLTRRSRTRHFPLDDDMAIVETRLDRDPEAAVSASLDRAALVAAIASLPTSLRTVVVLRDIYDLPHEAIAAELGISRAAAKVRLHRGRRRLRDLLFSAAPGEEAPARGEDAPSQHDVRAIAVAPRGRPEHAQAV
jgi:RNA polymerase sigma-70 factor (ECF subfamily)